MRKLKLLQSIGIVASILILTTAPLRSAQAQTNVNIQNTKYQTVLGWGGFPYIYSVPTAAQATVVAQLGINVGRIEVQPTLYNSNGTFDPTTLAKLEGWVGAFRTSGISNYMLDVWSPPAVWKTTGDPNTGSLIAGDEQAYANWYVSVIQKLQADGYGLPGEVSMQNEPNVNSPGYFSCYYSSGAQMFTVMQDMHTALANAGLTGIQVMGIESSGFCSEGTGCVEDYFGGDPFTALQNSANLNSIDAYCVHSYEMCDIPFMQDGMAAYPKNAWETEFSYAYPVDDDCGSTTDNEIDATVSTARDMMASLESVPFNYWFWWSLWDPSVNVPSQSCLIGGGNNGAVVGGRYYFLQKIFTTITPGWVVEHCSTNDPELLPNTVGQNCSSSYEPLCDMLAWQNSTGTASAVLIANQYSDSKTINVNGLLGSTATLYRSSSTQTMAQVGSGSITGGTYTISVPSNTVAFIVTSGGNSGSPPAAPTGLTAAGGVGSVTLSWNASPTATSYNILRSTTSGGESVIATDVPPSPYTDTGLITGKTYYYEVSGVNTAGTGSPSAQASAAPLAASLPIQINAGGPAVSPFIADTDFTGGGAATNCTGAIVTTGLINPAPQTVYQEERFSSPAMTYTIPGLTPGTTYLVRMHFCENFFTSSGQRVFDVNINGAQVLSNFDIYAATGAAHTATIQQFNEPANTSGQFIITFANVTNNALIDGLEVETAGPPSAPTGLTAAGSNTAVTLSWTASSLATSYNVYRGTTAGGESGTAIVSGVTTTGYINTGLTNGTTYYFTVKGLDTYGTSPASNEASAAPTTALPAAPTGLTATPGNEQVSLSWTASPNATSYNVLRSTVSGSGYAGIASGVTATGYTNTGLVNGTTYYYVVTAVNSNGTSGNSNQASGVPPAATLPIQINVGGPAVSPFVADTDYSGGTVVTNWTGAINTSGLTNPAPQAVYQDERFNSPTMSYTIPGLVNGLTYTVRLHFCEDFFSASGQRVFNVSINGTQVLTNFDIYATTGALYKATIQQFNEPANNSGQFVITFTNVTNNANIDGIEVVSAGSSAPPAPTGLSAAAGSTQVALSWNSSSGATSYNVYRGTSSGGENATAIVTGVTTTGCTNTGLTNGTTYYYTVKALNSAGTSGASNEAAATPIAVPAAPTGLTASPGNAQVALSWSTSTGATSYNVLRSTTSGSGYAQVVNVTTTSYTNTGLTNGTTYYFVVAAVNGSGTSANSSQASATPSGSGDTAQYNFETNAQGWASLGIVTVYASTAEAYAGVQSLDLHFNGAAGSSSAYVQGSPAAPAGSVVTYHLWVPSGSQITSVQPFVVNHLWNTTNGTSVSIGSLTTNAWNTLTITVPSGAALPLQELGINLVTGATWTGDAYLNSVSWPTGSAPPAPTGLTATPGSAQVALSWSSSTGATSYNVLRSTTSGSGYVQVTNVGTTAYTNTGLTNGTAYYFVVAAVNGSGTSANSSQASATPVAVPAAPTGLSATPGNAQVGLSWSSSTGATSYNVLRSTTSGSGYVQVTNVTTTSYTNTGLTNGATYYFVVAAVNGSGTSANSSQVSAIPQVSAPAAPTGLGATAGNTQVSLNWTASSGATSYNVYRGTTSGGKSATAVATGITAVAYTNTGLTNGTTYYFTVKALNAGGASGASNEANAAPTSSDTAQYNFETSAQGWASSGIITVYTSTAEAYAGVQSLDVHINGAAGSSDAYVQGSPGAPAGSVVTYHVWVPSGSQITSVQPFVIDHLWNTTNGTLTGIGSLTTNAWNTLTITVPSGANMPLQELGIHFVTGATYTGDAYIDSVSWN